jgi:hypothetical protein
MEFECEDVSRSNFLSQKKKKKKKCIKFERKSPSLELKRMQKGYRMCVMSICDGIS